MLYNQYRVLYAKKSTQLGVIGRGDALFGRCWMANTMELRGGQARRATA